LPNSLAQSIQGLLSDAMGNFIATATLKKNCELIGTTTEDLAAEDLPALAQKIEKSVTFFKDEASGQDLAQKIKAMG